MRVVLYSHVVYQFDEIFLALIIRLKLRLLEITHYCGEFQSRMNFVPSYASYPVEFSCRSHKPCLFDLKSD
jgi:hypothetical protein